VLTGFIPIFQCATKHDSQKTRLEPHLDRAIPSGREHPRLLVWVPEYRYTDVVVSLPGGDDLVRVPVPDGNLPIGITGSKEAHLWREIRRTCVAGGIVTTKSLLPCKLEFVIDDLEEDDSIVHRLPNDPLLRRSRSHRGKRVQTSVLDELRIDGDAPFPNSEGLVIRGGAEATILVEECYGIDRAKMPIILLLDIACPCIPLNDFLVVHAREEYVLLVFVRIELHHVRSLASVETTFHLSRLCVPQLDVVIEGGRDELGTVVVEADILHRHLVASVGANEFPIPEYIPELDLVIHGAREEHVRTLREPANSIDSLRMTLVGVGLLRWRIASVRHIVSSQVGTSVLRRFHP